MMFICSPAVWWEYVKAVSAVGVWEVGLDPFDVVLVMVTPFAY